MDKATNDIRMDEMRKYLDRELFKYLQLAARSSDMNNEELAREYYATYRIVRNVYDEVFLRRCACGQ